MSKKGINIKKAFEFIQTFYSEVSQLYIKLDDLMEREGWKSARGNTITRDVSKDLLRPKKWLPEGCFRLYEDKNSPNVRKGLIVGFIHNKIEEPLLIIGSVTYNKIEEAEDFDIWNIWFGDKQSKVLGRDYFEFDIENEELSNKIKECKLYAMNLVDVASEEDIKNKIFNKLIEF